MLSRSSESTEIGAVTLNVANNYFEGDNRIYCKNLSYMTAVYYGNEFNVKKSCLLFQGFGQSGEIRLKNNIWYKLSDEAYSSVNICSETSNVIFDKFIFVNNTFVGFSQINTVYLPTTVSFEKTGNNLIV